MEYRNTPQIGLRMEDRGSRIAILHRPSSIIDLFLPLRYASSVCPPSMTSACPVTKDASSETRKSTP